MSMNPEIIAIMWDGPYSIEEIATRFSNASDYGLYQIYGTHNIYGPDALLYIGKAELNSFAERIPSHKEWANWEASAVEVYLGRVSGNEEMTQVIRESWNDRIDRAERILIYFSSPPYCGRNIKRLGEMPATIVLNYKKRKRLPCELSSIYEQYVAEQVPRPYE